MASAVYAFVDDDNLYSVRDSLYALPTVATDQPTPDFDRAQFHGAFWTADASAQNLEEGFEALKKYSRQGSDFCKDIVEIMKERAAIEDMYGKKLQALYARSGKVAENTFGTLRDAWALTLNEFKERADWHLALCENIKKAVCDPLVSLEKQLRKDHKVIQAPVEKSLKTLYEIYGLVSKCKRTAHGKGKDAEAANVVVDDASQSMAMKGLTEKDVAKLSKAASNAERLRDKADTAYRDSMDKCAHAQEEWETSVINGCKGFQHCEEERVAGLRKVLQDYVYGLQVMVPTMDKCLNTLGRSIESIAPSDDVVMICQERGTGPYVFVQGLYDCHEENMQNAMDRTRRRTMLVDKVGLMRQELDKKEKMRVGLLKMWEATRDSVRDGKSDNRSLFAVSRRVIALDFGFAAIHASLFKLRCSLADVAGAERPTSVVSHMIDKREDKGVVNSYFRLPLSFRLDLDLLRREEALAAATDRSFGQPMAAVTRRQTMDQTRARNIRPQSDAPPPPPASAPPAVSTGARQTSSSLVPVSPAPPPPSLAPPPPEPALPVLCRCRAVYDYEPAEEDELRLRVGDELDVADNSDETWWQGTLHGRLGVFPAAYVKVL